MLLNKPVRFSIRDWDHIVDCYKNGESTVSLSRRFTVSRQSILRQIRKRNVIVRDSSEVRISLTLATYVSPAAKRCGDCQEVKPLGAYGLDNTKSDRLRNVCKTCDSKRQRRYKKNATKEQVEAARKQRLAWQNAHRDKVNRYAKTHRATIKGRFTASRFHALYTGRTWTIPFELYEVLVSRLCDYCGGPLPAASTGLDRLDNTKGYDPNNVAPCCSICNYTRRDQFSVEEMKMFIGPAIKAVRAARKACQSQQNLQS